MGEDVGWSDGEEAVVVVGLHVCTFKSATLAVWQYLCVCVFIFLFWRSLSSVPVKSCPPPHLHLPPHHPPPPPPHPRPRPSQRQDVGPQPPPETHRVKSELLFSLPPHPPPGGRSGAWHVDKSSCLSQPCALIRSSTSKDWIMACCPHACRSLPCCRTAGDRQSALNLWVSATRRRRKKSEEAVYTVGGRQKDDVFT